MSARRNATVTISVPLAASASRMASGDENFPVPKIRRDRKILPAMTNGEFIYELRLTIDDLGIEMTSHQFRKSPRFVEAGTNRCLESNQKRQNREGFMLRALVSGG